jgi:hypothetical protein
MWIFRAPSCLGCPAPRAWPCPRPRPAGQRTQIFGAAHGVWGSEAGSGGYPGSSLLEGSVPSAIEGKTGIVSKAGLWAWDSSFETALKGWLCFRSPELL